MSSTRDRGSTARWTSRSQARRSRLSLPDIDPAEAKRVIEIKGDNRYVTPGLIDIHTHVALWRSDGRRRHGLLRPGPDRRPRRRHDCARLRFGRCREHRRHALARHPESQDAHRHLRQRRQLRSHHARWRPTYSKMEDVDEKSIANAIAANPGLIKGLKLRMVGPVAQEQSEPLIDLCKKISRDNQIPTHGAHRRRPRCRLRQGLGGHALPSQQLRPRRHPHAPGDARTPAAS